MWPTLKFRLNGVGKSMRLVPLTLDSELTEFNCGDEQLNNFLYEDAKPSLELRIANTFILEDNGLIVAYFCLLNDKISKDEVIGSRWKKIYERQGQSAFRYITVDAYLSAVEFYEKNGFVHLTKKDEDEHTRLIFFDMMEMGE